MPEGVILRLARHRRFRDYRLEVGLVGADSERRHVGLVDHPVRVYLVGVVLLRHYQFSNGELAAERDDIGVRGYQEQLGLCVVINLVYDPLLGSSEGNLNRHPVEYIRLPILVEILYEVRAYCADGTIPVSLIRVVYVDHGIAGVWRFIIVVRIRYGICYRLAHINSAARTDQGIAECRSVVDIWTRYRIHDGIGHVGVKQHEGPAVGGFKVVRVISARKVGCTLVRHPFLIGRCARIHRGHGVPDAIYDGVDIVRRLAIQVLVNNGVDKLSSTLTVRGHHFAVQ